MNKKDWLQSITNQKFLLVFFAVGLVVISIYFVNHDESEDLSTEQLKALPYVTWTDVSEEDVGKSGVTFYNESAAYPGVNIYCSRGNSKASFINLEGETFLSFDAREQLGEYECILFGHYLGVGFVMITEPNALVGFDYDSNINFVMRGHETFFHHDLDFSKNGDLYVLGREDRFLPQINSETQIQDDSIMIFSPNMTLEREVWFGDVFVNDEELLDLAVQGRVSQKMEDINNPEINNLKIKESFLNFEKNLRDFLKGLRAFVKESFGGPIINRVTVWFTELYNSLTGDVDDVFHANSLEIIDESFKYEEELVFEKGNILFCLRNLDLIGVLDLDSEMVVWWWGPGELDRPHNPSLLPNGNVLVFDNGYHRNYSRVIEVNPDADEIVREYKKTPPEAFHSKTQGSAQFLPNGNVLITESNMGRVFEVTPEEEIVWEFWNPVVNNKNQRAVIYRMSRLTLDEWKYLKESAS